MAQGFCSARSYYHDYDTSSLGHGHCTDIIVIYRLITQLEKDNINSYQLIAFASV